MIAGNNAGLGTQGLKTALSVRDDPLQLLLTTLIAHFLRASGRLCKNINKLITAAESLRFLIGCYKGWGSAGCINVINK